MCGTITRETYHTLRVTRLESGHEECCMWLCGLMTRAVAAFVSATQRFLDRTCPASTCTLCDTTRPDRPVMFVSAMKPADATRVMRAFPQVSRVVAPGNVLTVLAHMAVLAAPALRDGAPLASVATLRAADETDTPFVVQDLLVYAAVVTQYLRDVDTEAISQVVGNYDEHKSVAPRQSVSIVQRGRPEMHFFQSTSLQKMKDRPKPESPRAKSDNINPSPSPSPKTVSVRILPTGSSPLVPFEPIHCAREW